jgi:hypothetical protein
LFLTRELVAIGRLSFTGASLQFLETAHLGVVCAFAQLFVGAAPTLS